MTLSNEELDALCRVLREAVNDVVAGVSFTELAARLEDWRVPVSEWSSDETVEALMTHFQTQSDSGLGWYSARMGGVDWTFGCGNSITSATGEQRGARAQGHAAAAAVFALAALLDKQGDLPSGSQLGSGPPPPTAGSNPPNGPGQDVSRDVAQLAQSVRELRELVTRLVTQTSQEHVPSRVLRPRTVGDEADRLHREALERSSEATGLVHDGMASKGPRDRYESEALEGIAMHVTATIAAIEALATRERVDEVLETISPSSELADEWVYDLAIARECARRAQKAVKDRYDRVVVYSIEGQKGINALRAAQLRRAPAPLLSEAAVQILGDKKSAESKKKGTTPSSGSNTSGGPSSRSSAGAPSSTSSN